MNTFLIGLGLGVAAGILLAPRSGRRTREYLADKAGEGTGYLKRRSQDAARSAGDMLNRGVDAVIGSRDAEGTGARLYGAR